MRLTTVFAQAILASCAIAAPFYPPTSKNQSSDIQKHKNIDSTRIKTSLTPHGFNKSSPQFPHKTMPTGLPFDSHPDDLDNFLTITSDSSLDYGHKNKTNAIAATHPRSRPTFNLIPKRDAAVATGEGHLDSVQDLFHPFEDHDKNHTKGYESQIGRASKSVQSLNATKFSDEAKAQRIIDQLQADLERCRKKDSHSIENQIDAIKEADDQLHRLNISRDSMVKHGVELRDHCKYIDGIYGLKDSCATGAGEERNTSRYSFYPDLFPNTDNRHSWNKTASTMNKTSHFWSDLSKLWEKRALSQSSSGDVAEFQSTQNTHPSSYQPLTVDGRLNMGRELMDKCKAYLDDENKVYPIDGSLPNEFKDAWTFITQYSLPKEFKKAFAHLVEEYKVSASQEPRQPQDGSGHIPGDTNAHGKLAHRQEEPAWFKKFIFPEADNAPLRRGDDVQWWDDESPEAKHDETVEVDWYAGQKHNITAENETSPFHVSAKNETEKSFPEEAQILGDLINWAISLELSQTNYTHSQSKRSLPDASKNLTLPFPCTKGTKHYSSKELASFLNDFFALLKSDQEFRKAVSTYIAEALLDPRNQLHAFQGKTNLAKPFEHASAWVSWDSSKLYSIQEKRDPSDNVKELKNEVWAELAKHFTGTNNTTDLVDDVFKYLHSKVGNHTLHAIGKHNSTTEFVKRNFLDDILKPFEELKNVTEHDINFLVSKEKTPTAVVSKKFNSSFTSEPSTYAKRDLLSYLRRLENEIKNATEDCINLVPSKTKNHTVVASGKHNSSATFDPSTYLRRDVPDSPEQLAIEKSYNETKNATEEAEERFASKWNNITFRTPGKLNHSSVDAQATKQAAKRFDIPSIDSEKAYRKFHAEHSKSTKASKRQTTAEEAFSQEESSDAWGRYVSELGESDGSEPTLISTAEGQDKIRTKLREMAQKSSGSVTMKKPPTSN